MSVRKSIIFAVILQPNQKTLQSDVETTDLALVGPDFGHLIATTVLAIRQFQASLTDGRSQTNEKVDANSCQQYVIESQDVPC